MKQTTNRIYDPGNVGDYVDTGSYGDMKLLSLETQNWRGVTTRKIIIQLLRVLSNEISEASIIGTYFAIGARREGVKTR